MQWDNPNGTVTNGVVIEDGAGNKLGTAANPLNVTGGGGGGGGGSNASVGATGASVPASATAIGYQNASGNLTLPTSAAGLPVADSGAAITGASMPPGGVGLTGWISANWSKLGSIVSALPSLVATTAGAAARSVVSDPSSGVGALVTAFHNADNQTIGAASYGVMTGGVAQLINSSGNLNRQRETSFDGVPAAGVAAGAQQLAGPLVSTTVTSGAITANVSAQTVALNAVSFTNRGVTTTIQVGSELLVDAGMSQETVYVSAVNTATKQVTAIFSKSHAANVAVATFAYNQARDATIPDGATPAGIAASAEYFYNAPMQTVEAARSAAGELDGATGTGTAVAAEYEWNGGGPINNSGAITGLAFDRSRNLQGKGGGGSTLNGVTSAGASSVTLNSVVGLQAGQQIRLDRGLGTEESAYVSATYVGGQTVALQSPLAQAHSNGGTVDWDIFVSAGPGLNGFTPTGIGIEEEALYDPVSGKYFIERAATQDNCPPQNVVLENAALWNGTGMDRLRSVSGDGMGATGIEASADLLWNGSSYDRPREVIGDGQAATGIPAEAAVLFNGSTYDRLRSGAATGSALVQQIDNSVGVAGAAVGGSATVSSASVLTGFPVNTTGYQSMLLECAVTFTGTIIFEGSNDNWVTAYPILASRSDLLSTLPVGSYANPGAGYLWDIPLKFAQVRVRCSAYTSGSGVFQWTLKSGPVARTSVDQGAAGASSSPWYFVAKTQTTGGIPSMTPLVGAATNNLTTVKSSAGQLYKAVFSNNAATWAYLHFYNGAPTMGTTAAVATYGIPPSGNLTVDASDLGVPFSTGVYASVTAGIALTDNTSLAAASTVCGTFHYA